MQSITGNRSVADSKKNRNMVVHAAGIVLKSSIDTPVVDVLAVSVTTLDKMIRKHCEPIYRYEEDDLSLKYLVLALCDSYTYLPEQSEKLPEFF